MPGSGPLEVRGYRDGDEEAIVALLNLGFAGGWGTLERWRERHAERAGFDPRDVYLAFRGDDLIGCLHVAVVTLRVGPGATLLAGLDGDLAVRPEARGQGVPELLYQTATASLRDRGVAIRMGYTDETSRAEFYQRVLGYVAGFDATRAYSKSLTADAVIDPLLRRFGSSRDATDPGRGPILEVTLTGLPSFRVRLGDDRVAVATDPAAPPALRIVGNQRILGLLASDRGRLRRLWGLVRRDDVRFFATPWRALGVLAWYLRAGRRQMRGGAGRG